MPGHDEGDAERRNRLEAETRRLRVWAREARRLKDRFPGEDARGGEHTVVFDEATQRIWRATRPETMLGYGLAHGSWVRGATPGEYLDRWALHNHLFADDVRLEYVAACAGRVKVVTSQPFIRGRDARPEATHAFMEARGFARIGPGAFYHEGFGLLADDLFARNVKVSGRGVVLPIDPVLQRITPEFAGFLRDYYYAGCPDEPKRASNPPTIAGRDADSPGSAPGRRRLTGVKLELDEPTLERMAVAVDADLMRERYRQPNVTQREALRQIAETLPLSESARAELDRIGPEDGLEPA
jgi:hypothetical protein